MLLMVELVFTFMLKLKVSSSFIFSFIDSEFMAMLENQICRIMKEAALFSDE